MKTASILIGYFVFSALIGMASFFVGIPFVSCERFGWSNFEGECGYGAIVIALPLAILGSLILFSLLSIVAMRRTPENLPPYGTIPKSLYWAWIGMFILRLASVVLSITSYDIRFTFLLPVLTLAFFLLVSISVAYRTGKTPAFALLALVPYIGTIVVAALLFRSDITEWLRRKSA